MIRNRKKMKKIVGGIKSSYRRVETEYKTFQRRPTMAQKIRGLKKKPRVRKLRKISRKVGQNIDDYFDESQRQIRKFRIDPGKIKF